MAVPKGTAHSAPLPAQEGDSAVLARHKRAARRGLARGGVAHLLVGFVGLIFAFPFVWMVMISSRSDQEIFRFPPTILPETWALYNYADAFHYIPFLLYTYNTVLIAGLNVVGTLGSCALAAYAFSRVQWHGRGFVFLLVLSTMLLPYPVTLIPLYVIFKNLGWVGTFAPLTVPAFFGNAFYIFLLRQFFLTLPREYDQAALVDGASHMRIFWRIIMPLARPALAVVALLTFLGSWTDFFGPLIYLTDPSTFTLSLGMLQYQSLHAVHWGQLMAASVMFMLPVIILFLVAQRTFVQGITMTGLKG
ncbi:MAG: carbohydrate ABC transporter permease [Chloroflexota bacterium]